jgi:phage-related protein
LVNVTLSLIGSNGDTILLDGSEDYHVEVGLTGFGIPSTEVRIDQSAGDGGVWKHTKRGVREVDLPVTITGDSEADVQAKLRRLSRLLQTTLGPTKLVATFEDESSLFLEVHYTAGAETQFGEDATIFYCRWVLTLQAPQPYWETSEEIHYVIGEEPTGRGLLPQLTKLKISSDNILGEITINNLGDVPSYPRWVFLGPISNVLVSNGTQSFTLPDLIPAGETITVDTATGEVYDTDGVNVYSLLGPAPKLFSFPSGITEITVTGDETDDATRVAFYYSPMYEVVH